MSALWCLTGSLDTRLVYDAKVANVVHQGLKTSKRTGSARDRQTAEVTVSGYINGQRFEVVRRRGADSKSTSLCFHYAGKDVTQQTMRDTQDKIDDILGIGNDLLLKSTFFGQHSLAQQVL